MATKNPQNTYDPFEEKLNVITHAIGFILSVIALPFLIIEAIKSNNTLHLISFIVFGISMITLYLASTLYHHSTKEKLKYHLNIFDHSSIFLLIAGTYTPFVLITLNGTLGWILFGVTWSLAIIGISLKLFFTGRFQIPSTIMYVLMGWIIVFAINPLMKSLPIEGLYWLLAGGIAYTIGALLFSWNRLKLNHAIFHIFVMLGTFFHFVSIYYFVSPND